MSAARPFQATPATKALLDVYADPIRAGSLSPADWSAVLGSARRSRTLGHLALRLRLAGVGESIEPRVLGHFDSASNVIRQRSQALRWEIMELAQALKRVDFPVVLLKGAAYEVQQMPLAASRLAADVDLLVPRECLSEAERHLREGGWQSLELNDYDERYYREWSHEIPPLAHPSRGVEVDVHHSIGPGLSGESAAVRDLFRASMPVSWCATGRLTRIDRFRVLQPLDQLVHVALHTFGSSDLKLRLREVMDFDHLLRGYCVECPQVDQRALMSRAAELGQQRAMWWMLHYSSRWLGTPVEPRLMSGSARPSSATVAAMDWLADRSMLPGRHQRRTRREFLAEMTLLARYQWQRLPVHRLVPHVLEKLRRRLVGQDELHV